MRRHVGGRTPVAVWPLSGGPDAGTLFALRLGAVACRWCDRLTTAPVVLDRPTPTGRVIMSWCPACGREETRHEPPQKQREREQPAA
jgi:hypothetical protein